MTLLLSLLHAAPRYQNIAGICAVVGILALVIANAVSALMGREQNNFNGNGVGYD